MITEPYCTEAEADEYFSVRLNAEDWTSAGVVEANPSAGRQIRLTGEDGEIYSVKVIDDDGTKALGVSEYVEESEPGLYTRKYKSLVMASDAIDRLSFRGSKVDEDQDREFPRFDATTPPLDIKKACAEEALSLLQGNDPNEMLNGTRATSKSFDGASVSYDSNTALAHISAGITSAVAWSLLLPYLRDIRSIRFDRG